METFTLDVALSADEVARRLPELAEGWGAEWEPHGGGGRLRLPVVLGLRRGTLAGEVAIEARTSGCRLTWRLESSELRVHRAAVGVLSLAAFAALGTLAWPFYPQLLEALPVALLLAFSAWWLVINRLRTSGPQEFLEQLLAPPPEAAREPRA